MFKIMKLCDRYPRWYYGYSTLHQYVLDYYNVHDTDNCGSDVYYFAVWNEDHFEYYEVEHQWYWSTYPRCEDESEEDYQSEYNQYVDNEYNYITITEQEARTKVKKWLVV